MTTFLFFFIGWSAFGLIAATKYMFKKNEISGEYSFISPNEARSNLYEKVYKLRFGDKENENDFYELDD